MTQIDEESFLVDSKSAIYSDFDGLKQDCSNSIANALELLQSCTKPSIWGYPSL